MEQVGRYGIVSSDIVRQRLGTVLGELEVVRLATLGRGVTGDIDTRDLDIGIVLDEHDGVRYRVQLGAVVLVFGQNVVAVLPELQACGTVLGTHLHGFGSGCYAVQPVFGDIRGQYAGPQLTLGLAFAAVRTTVYLLADFDPSVEHPALVGHGCRVVVALLFAFAAYDDLRLVIMVRGKVHAFEPLRPQVHLVTGAAVNHDGRESHLAAVVGRHEYGGQRHGVLRVDFGLAQIHGHLQADGAALLDNAALTDFNRGEIAGFVLGM